MPTKKAWPLSGTRIHLRRERDHVEEWARALEEEQSKVQTLHREMALLGNALTRDQRAKTLTIADGCAVHHTLEGHLHIHPPMIEKSCRLRLHASGTNSVD